MKVVVTSTAASDLEELPDEVGETFLSKRNSAEKNMELGATPEQSFDKYLAGNMHPVLQMNLGRDYRAWFIEGEYLEFLDDEKIYCFKVLRKSEAKKLTGRIVNSLDYLGSVL